ncbi:hypothetical protein Pmani_034118 [Petrolisthes manimaculis]|uniref:Uncharacterized protein n=1 Tax=Petrolisthes manimaculis TaxID=1843537 RepID=A0AAE1TRY1_9EUCA|nr:hypothetical protein Pmani_034118 [Petrolisthes manimaculis]
MRLLSLPLPFHVASPLYPASFLSTSTFTSSPPTNLLLLPFLYHFLRSPLLTFSSSSSSSHISLSTHTNPLPLPLLSSSIPSAPPNSFTPIHTPFLQPPTPPTPPPPHLLPTSLHSYNKYADPYNSRET